MGGQSRIRITVKISLHESSWVLPVLCTEVARKSATTTQTIAFFSNQLKIQLNLRAAINEGQVQHWQRNRLRCKCIFLSEEIVSLLSDRE